MNPRRAVAHRLRHPVAALLLVIGGIPGGAPAKSGATGATGTSGSAAPAIPGKAERIRALPDEERQWLTEYVAPIILPEEERLFLEIVREEHRLVFKEEFWKRRERDGLRFPLGPGYRGRYEELRRLADTTYDGWKNDAGRMVIAHGEPAAIDTLDACRGVFRDLEIWRYGSAARAPAAGRHFFYRTYPQQPRRLWNSATPDAEVLSPGGCRKTFKEMELDCIPPDARSIKDRCSVARCAEQCAVFNLWTEIRSRQGGAAGGTQESGQLLAAPDVSTEGLDLLRERMATSAAPGAKTIAIAGAGAPPAAQSSTAAPATPAPLPQQTPTRTASAAAVLPGLPRSVPKLTARQRAEKIRELPEEERQWLTDYVQPIILPEERDLFLQLPQEYQREAFKKEFWGRRERDGLTPPLGPGYQSRYGHLREVAAEEYDGLSSDAGRMVVRLGEPAAIELLNGCSEVFRQGEIWTYPAGSSSREIRHLFYRPSFGAPRRLWLRGDTEIFQTASCIASFDQACATGPNGIPPKSANAPCGGNVTVPKTCREACAVARVAEEIAGRGPQEASLGNSVPPVSTEGLEGLWNRYASLSTPGAKPISIESAGTVAAVPAAAAPAEPAAKPDWSNEAIRARILALPKKYRDWLDLAGPLLSESELVAFLDLPASGRDGYIRKFWKLHAHTK